jgi:hypothetical protein
MRRKTDMVELIEPEGCLLSGALKEQLTLAIGRQFTLEAPAIR